MLILDTKCILAILELIMYHCGSATRSRTRCSLTRNFARKRSNLCVEFVPLRDLTASPIKLGLLRLGVAAEVDSLRLWEPVVGAPGLAPEPCLVKSEDRQDVLHGVSMNSR